MDIISFEIHHSLFTTTRHQVRRFFSLYNLVIIAADIGNTRNYYTRVTHGYYSNLLFTIGGKEVVSVCVSKLGAGHEEFYWRFFPIRVTKKNS